MTLTMQHSDTAMMLSRVMDMMKITQDHWELNKPQAEKKNAHKARPIQHLYVSAHPRRNIYRPTLNLAY